MSRNYYKISAACQVRLADGMVENVIGVIGVPLGIATNLLLDGRELLVPMATEESSVIVAVCNAVGTLLQP